MNGYMRKLHEASEFAAVVTPIAGPRSIGCCWDIADERIAHYKAALDAALRGEGRANVAICREKIDQWLEYRHAHGPTDEAVL